MAGIGLALEQAYPNMPTGFAGFGLNVVPLYEHIYGKSTRPALWLIMAVAICVLLIAVTNIANLLLARLNPAIGSLRCGSLSERAGHRRLARQVIAEVSLLAIPGGVLGTALAAVGLRILIAAFVTRLPRLEQASLDWRVLAIALAATLEPRRWRPRWLRGTTTPAIVAPPQSVNEVRRR